VKILRCFLLLMLVLNTPLFIYAQGVPKAFEAYDYAGAVDGRLVRFNLADGYIGASYIQLFLTAGKKPLKFEPDAGTPNENNQLKFIPFPESRSGYFLLHNVQAVYDNLPSRITGYYFLKNKKTRVRLVLIVSHKH